MKGKSVYILVGIIVCMIIMILGSFFSQQSKTNGSKDICRIVNFVDASSGEAVMLPYNANTKQNTSTKIEYIFSEKPSHKSRICIWTNQQNINVYINMVKQ